MTTDALRIQEIVSSGTTIFHIHLYITSAFLNRNLTDQDKKKLTKLILKKVEES